MFSFRTRTQFFQILCEEVMNKATKLIDVDKIFLAKSNEGAVYVLNALKLCLYWKTINEYIMDIYDDHFDIELYEGNMFGSIMAFIRHSSPKLIIPFESQLFHSIFKTCFKRQYHIGALHSTLCRSKVWIANAYPIRHESLAGKFNHSRYQKIMVIFSN